MQSKHDSSLLWPNCYQKRQIKGYGSFRLPQRKETDESLQEIAQAEKPEGQKKRRKAVSSGEA